MSWLNRLDSLREGRLENGCDLGDESLGTGVPTSPVISQKPAEQAGATDVFLTVSGGGGAETVTRSLSELLEQKGSPARTRLEETPPQAQITHWRDKRVR